MTGPRFLEGYGLDHLQQDGYAAFVADRVEELPAPVRHRRRGGRRRRRIRNLDLMTAFLALVVVAGVVELVLVLVAWTN